MPYLSVKNLMELGILHEVNRQFFHPLGLALEVEVEDDGSGHITGILDHRSEGIVFAELNRDNMKAFEEWQAYRHEVRREQAGCLVQEEDQKEG